MKKWINKKTLTCVLATIMAQSSALACTSSQGAVADNARSLGITYINLAIKYYQLTGNATYKGYAKYYWNNQLAWRSSFNSATSKATCFRATIGLQKWTAQMNVNVASLESYIAAVEAE